MLNINNVLKISIHKHNIGYKRNIIVTALPIFSEFIPNAKKIFNSMLKYTILLIVITVLLIHMVSINEARRKRKVRQGPRGMGRNQSTSCQEFSKYARFNPYSVLHEIWFVFYYWAAPRPIEVYQFFIPTANQTKFLHKMFDGKVTRPVNWTARHVMMHGRHNQFWLLVERGERGEYWSYLLARVKKAPIEAQDVRLRQHDNGRLLGLMECESENVYIMSRINEVPLHSKIQEEAARFGHRARRGKSYLYRGHEWMPVPEADENEYFTNILPQIVNDTANVTEGDLSNYISDESTESKHACPHRAVCAERQPTKDLEETQTSNIQSGSNFTYKLQTKFPQNNIEDPKAITVEKQDTINTAYPEKNTQSETQSFIVSERPESVIGSKEETFHNNLKECHSTEKSNEKSLSEAAFSEHNYKLGKLTTTKHKGLLSSYVSEDPLEQTSLQFDNKLKVPEPTEKLNGKSESDMVFQENSNELGRTTTTNQKGLLSTYEPEDSLEQKSLQSKARLKLVSESQEEIMPETSKKLRMATTTNQKELQPNYKHGDSLDQKSLQSTDRSHEITDEISSIFSNVDVVNHMAVLQPVEPEVLENQLQKVNYDNKIHLPIPSPPHLPPKCYEMELVKESIETSPANLPAILNQLLKAEQSIPKRN